MKHVPAVIFHALVSLFFLGMTVAANSQNNAESAPAKTVAVVSALEQAGWQNLESGLQVIRGMTPEGLVFTAFKVSPDYFAFSLALQASNKGERVREVAEREGAVLAVNGGFFAVAENGTHFPVGFLRSGGKGISNSWPNTGGLLVFKESGVSLLPARDGVPKTNEDVIQSKPMMIEPGGKWAMRTNLENSERRTVVCKLKDGNVVIGVVTRSGMSLYEAGWLMREKTDGGFFGCDSAMALDGGGSTQVWFSGEPQYSFTGITPVHNFLVVRGKN